MRKRNKILLGILFTILSLPILLYGLLLLFADNLQQYVVSELNKELITEVKVSTIHLSIIQSFPNVTLTFDSVSIGCPKDMKGPKMLSAHEVVLKFNFWDIVNRNYQVSSINLNAARVHIYYDAHNNANYRVLKPQQGESNPLILKLNQIKFRQLHFIYEDVAGSQYHEFNADEAELGGAFNDTEFDLAVNGNFLIKQLRIDKTNYISNKKLHANLLLHADAKKNIYTFKRGDLRLDAMLASITGSIQSKPEGLYNDLRFAGTEMTIPSLISILPGDMAKLTHEYRSTGNIYLNGTLKGLLSNKSSPDISISFGIANGTLQKPTLPAAIKNIELKGELLYTSKKSELYIKPCHLMVGSNSIEGSLMIQNFSDPLIKANINGSLALNEISTMIDIKGVNNLDGDAEINFLFEGMANELNDGSSFAHSKNNAYLRLRNVRFDQDSTHIKNLSGDIRFNGRLLDVSDLTATINENEIYGSGKIENFANYIFSNQTLHATLSLNSNYINLEKLLVSAADTTSGSKPSRIEANIETSIAHLVYKKFSADDIHGVLTIKESMIELKSFDMQTLGGSINLKECIWAKDNEKSGIIGNAKLSHLDISKAFYTFNEFGQSTLTSQNLKGYLDADDIKFSIQLNSQGEVLSDKVYILSHLRIKNGELINFEPVTKLSKFADVNDLKNLKFQTLENTIEVKNRTTYIPQMMIQNNALNLTISGSHTFDNYMDYRIKLRLSNLLLKSRNKKTDGEFGEYEEGNSRGLNLYIHMKGTPDKLDISYDKIGVKKKLKEDFKIEKKNIKEQFKKEFGSSNDADLNPSKKDTAVDETIHWEE
jgi:hypothetical protein